MKKRIIILTCTLPDDANVQDVRHYILDALGSWGGSYIPDDPMRDGIQVKSITFRHPRVGLTGSQLLDPKTKPT